MWLWLACGMGSSSERTDAQYYLSALKRPQQALEECVRIRDEDTQGECLLFAATEGKHGSEACALAHSERWKEACFFEVIDRAGVPRNQAKDSCARTGRFQNRCVYHIVQRMESDLMKRFPPGKEEELSAYIRTEVEALGGEDLKRDPLSKSLVSRIVARRFFKHWRADASVRFSARVCGGASTDVCTMAYRFVLRLSKKQLKPCQPPPNKAWLERKGLPHWEDDFQPQARKVWSELCR